MSTSAKAVGRVMLAATALFAILLTPTATGVSQARGMRASGGALRSSGSLGARRGPGVPGTSAASRGLRVRATASGITVRSGSWEGHHEGHEGHEGHEEGHLLPPASFAFFPLTPGRVIFPFSSVVFPFSSAFLPFQSFFSGAVFSPIIPGTIVNPLFPGTIFVPLFPTSVVSPTFPFNTFLPTFPTTFVSPFTPISAAAIGFAFPPSIVTPLTPGVVPPLIPQFIVLPVQIPLAFGSEHGEHHEGHEGHEEPGPDTRAAQVGVQRAGATAKGSARAAGSAPAANTTTVVMRVTAVGQSPDTRALQEWVRTQNVGAALTPAKRGAPAPAEEGSPSPKVRPAKSEGGSAAVESAFGRPAHAVAFVPRTVFFDDFFTTRDGRMGFKQFRHHPVMAGNYYYPHYVNDPSWFAFEHPGAYPSVYALWGWTPPWVSGGRVSVTPANGIGGPSYPEESTGDPDLAGAARCVEGIRTAWLTGDPQRLAPYLSRQQDIRVYFNGKYQYDTPAADYYAMTVDAFRATRTTALVLELPLWFSTGDVVVTGRAAFQGPEGNPKTVYVSYKMRRLEDGWRITDFGSSLEPMQSDGAEFAS